jgi:hypothetical protein
MMSFEMNTIYFAYTNDDAAIVYCDAWMARARTLELCALRV